MTFISVSFPESLVDTGMHKILPEAQRYKAQRFFQIVESAVLFPRRTF